MTLSRLTAVVMSIINETVGEYSALELSHSAKLHRNVDGY